MFIFKIDGISDPENMFIIQESFQEFDQETELEFDIPVSEVIVHTEKPLEKVANVFYSNGFPIEAARSE